ncbi:MAG: hypothetical protein LBT71_09730, partial [Azoarcus sp.]|nr:hypothetical protein [Azoarcus sp.]
VLSENGWVAADSDGLLRVWNGASGEVIGQYDLGRNNHQRYEVITEPFAFQPGGNKLAAIHDSGNLGIRIFELPEAAGKAP